VEAHVADSASNKDVARLNAFTDGIFVVSMTLLVLDIRLPDLPTENGDRELIRALSELWPKYFGYAVSFLVIAQYWLGFTSKFGSMRSIDSTFAWLNMLFLLVVGFVPFATTILTGHRGSVATSLYAATMIVLSLQLIGMWLYATRKALLETNGRVPTWRDVEPWIRIAAVFAISIAVAQLHPTWARAVWLFLALPLDRILQRTAP
jgi:TMEM175 potassium channel family protein